MNDKTEKSMTKIHNQYQAVVIWAGGKKRLDPLDKVLVTSYSRRPSFGIVSGGNAVTYVRLMYHSLQMIFQYPRQQQEEEGEDDLPTHQREAKEKPAAWK